MRQYLDLMQLILDRGVEQQDRTGTGTRSWFGAQMRFDLADGFPLLTTKKLHLRSIIVELLWFLRGDTNIGWLKDRNVRIWDEWANEKGDLGPVYGKQWRDWETADGRHIDQIADLVDLILGVPFNIASYSLLTHMLARECGLEPGVFVWTGGDCHIYSNPMEQVALQLGREPRPLPRLVLKDRGQGL